MAASEMLAELIAVSELVLASLEERPMERLTEAERVFAAIWGLEADVNNGGFDQFFFNSSGDMAFLAPRALEIIGAPTMAKIVRGANAIFGEAGPPRDRDLRQKLLAAMPEGTASTLEALDSEFCAYPDDLTTLLHRYLTTFAPELLAQVRK